MKAGSLDKRIQVQEPIETKTTMGEAVNLWVYRGKVWGDIKSIGGRERFIVNQAKPVHDTVITIRGTAAPYLTTKMRLVHVERTFDIEAIGDPDGRKVMKEIYCKEQAA